MSAIHSVVNACLVTRLDEWKGGKTSLVHYNLYHLLIPGYVCFFFMYGAARVGEYLRLSKCQCKCGWSMDLEKRASRKNFGVHSVPTFC